MNFVSFSISRKKGLTWGVIVVMVFELLTPNIAIALSSGPVQPEISSFEPVGTTDMVDLFTGDFVYNIPLLDVDGYPVNISYHGGVTMEQEASWVGLGWNINPGAINRAVRGLPDEFNGELIEKELNIKPEISKTIGTGVGVELFGMGEPYISLGANLGGYLNISNYKGISVDFTTSAGINTNLKFISAGFNVGATIGSQTGGAVDYNANLGLGITQSINKNLAASGNFGVNYSGVYSPRTSLRQSLGAAVSVSAMNNKSGTRSSLGTGTSIPIGLQNQTAAITNAYYSTSFTGQLKVGGALLGGFANAKVLGTLNKTSFEPDGSRRGFGYFNLANAAEEDLLDFSREKDGMYNSLMQFLPQSQITYDVYNVSGQGTSGSFRPFRNDLGSIYDPSIMSNTKAESYTIEAGLGNLFSLGGEAVMTKNRAESGCWEDYKRLFSPKATSGFYEDVYFKEAGELTENNETYLNAFANNTPVTPEQMMDLPVYKVGSGKRVVRANHIYTVSGESEDAALLISGSNIISYEDTVGFKNYPTLLKDTIQRVSNAQTKKLKRKSNHLNEIVQTQKDGRRYVYGLPVLNNVQREVMFAVDPSNGNTLDKKKYLINYTSGVDDSYQNTKGLDNFYASTVTPTYVAAHLLTSVLSSDYIDVTGDGVSDDDLGSYTKFNYTKKSADYRWRSPIQQGKALYIPNNISDRMDDKASFIIGSREQWLLHSIETKNNIAEFYVSKRLDALGVTEKILGYGNLPDSYNEAPYNNTASSNDAKSYKLDSIVLFNKNDRLKNGANAVPIKTVYFTYDYSLCKHAPNSAPGEGKLTLKKIQTKFGASNLNMSAAYDFVYSSLNPNYHEADKDRWGYYKENDTLFNNFEFPFVDQSSSTDDYASAWSLKEIILPSGGKIEVDYEADDYAYVQDKYAMEMFKIYGVGSSASFSPGSFLYLNKNSPNLYLYFKRRIAAEHSNLSMKENYFNTTDPMYFNMAVSLVSGSQESIKGYAEVEEVNICEGNSAYGYVKLAPKILSGSGSSVNPITYTALNVGRYSLPHILFPGSNPESTDISNVVTGLRNAISELFSIARNPLDKLMEGSKGRVVNPYKSFIRLTSPGLNKKGGGQRVKSVRFYDNWNAMSGATDAVYGKTYEYRLKRDNGNGYISSGVASYEPMTGGDEIPFRLPIKYIAQKANQFPPNDPVELYQEYPIGESFFPAPVVGYSSIKVQSIHIDKGRSSQSEHITEYYTAKDFPVKVSATNIKQSKDRKVSIKDVKIQEEATQGFSIVLNDMHGKLKNTERWMLKPAGADSTARELISRSTYIYRTKEGELNNQVPVLSHNPNLGRLSVASKKLGIETDLTLDSRQRTEESKTVNISGNLNSFLVLGLPIIIPLIYPFEFETNFGFKCATATKVTLQYGILHKVINTDQGAVTVAENEVFDDLSGNVLISSTNNEYKDKLYTVSYPAYWAYKEMGASYENFGVANTFENPLMVDSLGADYAGRFANYNPSFSAHYTLSDKMPVARVIIDEKMPEFKLGDELLLTHPSFGNTLRVWVMGYTSDLNHCYLILANREPYQLNTFWNWGISHLNVKYRVLHSGNKNRLTETIQQYTTADSSNIYPYLKNELRNVIDLNAASYKHNKSQVFAQNLTSDSLNPYVTGKVGIHRQDMQIYNMRNRNYSGNASRNAGLFNTMAYWQVEKDNFASYCPDSLLCLDCGMGDSLKCDKVIDSLHVIYMGSDIYGNDSFKAVFKPYPNEHCSNPRFNVGGWLGSFPGIDPDAVRHFPFSGNGKDSFSFKSPGGFTLYYSNGCCNAVFQGGYHSPTSSMLERLWYVYSHSTSTPVKRTDTMKYEYSSTHVLNPALYVNTPHRIRRKIMLGKVGHYEGMDQENWIKPQITTKFNRLGQEIENKEEGMGYNHAVYSQNLQQPIGVAKNAKHGDVLFEGFEDYNTLQPVANLRQSYMALRYSPFFNYFKSGTMLGDKYKVLQLLPSGSTMQIVQEDAHTGFYSLRTSALSIVNLNPRDTAYAEGYSFNMSGARKYVVSVWAKPVSGSSGILASYSLTPMVIADTVLSGTSGASISKTLTPKSNIIEGWQKFEIVFDVEAPYKKFSLSLPAGYYYDDIRISPFESSNKSFVYHPVTRNLMAVLDENNYATLYEYDAEGNLVRVKKETEKGILTLSESRQGYNKNR
jgi:hypothetical protein